uniref:Uncharacterized protein n=1 Tax=Oryza sativa subsp. japonica TaxID=39947 RepID=Q69LY7_ORYSJ|nr:hypothetical protein [Oryza sativa Japonica Group]
MGRCSALTVAALRGHAGDGARARGQVVPAQLGGIGAQARAAGLGGATTPGARLLQADFRRLDRMAPAPARRGSSRRCGRSSHAASSLVVEVAAEVTVDAAAGSGFDDGQRARRLW